MSVEIKEVIKRPDMRKFIHLPAKIHKNHTNWLPPVYLDEWSFFDKKKNKSFLYCDTVLLLAIRKGKVVGRIMGIINNKYNQLHNEATARFGYLESWDDKEIIHALLQSVEKWSISKGMNKIIGPYGFSDKDPQGFLIEGFDKMPIPVSACNFEYVIPLIEAEGYKKEIDCYVYKYDLSNSIPEVYKRILQRVESQNRYELHEFHSKRQLKPFIIPVLQLMNKTYNQIYGFVPLDHNEMESLAGRYMPILKPEFVKIITYNDEVISFILGIPNLTRGIQKSKGYLMPFGIFKIMHEANKTRQIDLMLGATKEEFRGRGLDVFMVLKLIDSARALKFSEVEIHLMLETNFRMLSEMKKIGASKHKKFRVYQKILIDK